MAVDVGNVSPLAGEKALCMPHRLAPPARRSFARRMRSDATKAENLLWQALRGRQLGGLKFRRQMPLAGYILDFVCLEAKLIVEVDGSQHAGSERDSERDGYVASQGFRTLGFWNDEVELDCDAVCLAILRAAGQRH